MPLFCLLFSMGCTTTDVTPVSPTGFAQTAAANVKPEEMNLAAGDTIELSVEVDGQMEVSRHRAPINFSGKVTLPLVGDVKISGLRLEQARTVIANAYGSYYVNPPVVMLTTIEDVDAGDWGAVTVTGKVGKPGLVPIASAKGIRLSAVIQAAGGFAASAKSSSILITRTDAGGKRVQVTVDYNDIGQKGNVEADIYLKDGDVIYVPERWF